MMKLSEMIRYILDRRMYTAWSGKWQGHEFMCHAIQEVCVKHDMRSRAIDYREALMEYLNMQYEHVWVGKYGNTRRLVTVHTLSRYLTLTLGRHESSHHKAPAHRKAALRFWRNYIKYLEEVGE